MPLDLAILGPDGAPTSFLGIRTEVHERMMAAARCRGAGLLLRLSDYYCDAEYDPVELPTLMTEVATVLREVGEDDELACILAKFIDLVNRAMLQGTGISAIAD